MGIIMRSQTFHEPFAILTGSEPKSQIIMQKVLEHSFDHEMFYRQLELDADEPLDRLRRSRNRKHITWKGGGGVQTFTADARNRRRVKESLTGFGSKNIAEDEASLIPDDLQAMVLRMLGGHKDDSYLLKIGNPFYRNHFLRSWNSSRYRKVFIDYHQALREGRYGEDFIEEMRQEPFFSILYECKFPEDNEVDTEGWRRIILDDQLQNTFDIYKDKVPFGVPVLGVDVGGGGDETTFVVKFDNLAFVASTNKSKDSMANVAIIRDLHEQYHFKYIIIDDTGVGHGLSDRLIELGFPVIKFIAGASATDRTRFANAKSEAYWHATMWLTDRNDPGAIQYHDRLMEWQHIRYKEDSSSRLIIEPKERMAERGIRSPDVVEAFILCFAGVNYVSAKEMFG